MYIYVDHRYTYPGCRIVLVPDGNMKNRRNLCLAKDASFIEFENLPGSIKSGCQRTPAYKSRYCKHHMNQVCTLTSDSTPDEELSELMVGPPVHSKQTKSKHPGDPIVKVLISKKVTRRETYYQVC